LTQQTDLIEWLIDSRGLDAALIKDMQIKVQKHDKLGDVIAFPYIRAGKKYAGKFRNAAKQFLSTQGVTRGFYNEDVLDQFTDQPIVITEGEIDALSDIQAGFLRTISVPDGWTEQGNKTDIFVQEEKRLRNSPYIIVAGDNDKAGESMPRAVANVLSGHDVRYVVWPDGCKDANDVLREYGDEKVAECLNSAKRIDPPGGLITGFSDLPPMSARRILRTGLDFLDGRVALELGTISVWTGTPGSGKTTIATYIGDKVAVHENVRVGFLSFETHSHATRDHLSLIRTGTPYEELSVDRKAELEFELDKSWRLVHRADDGDHRHHLGWFESMVDTLAMRDGCKWIILDPWNEIEHLPEPGESLTNYINFALQRIRTIAKRLEIHITVVAHPKKMNQDWGDRAPGGYDIADSAAFYNKPALGVTIHNHVGKDGVKTLRLHTWKVRDVRSYGFEKGSTELMYNVDTMTYYGVDNFH
tara:strand:+ start:3912 stop:5330 length:1419 start_codon:yes stop_codon:yes gene_type:complete